VTGPQHGLDLCDSPRHRDHQGLSTIRGQRITLERAKLILMSQQRARGELFPEASGKLRTPATQLFLSLPDS
jgi:hypothetical protein